jgi:hypothetical protein
MAKSNPSITIKWIASMKEFAERFRRVHGADRAEVQKMIRAGRWAEAIHRVEVLTSHDAQSV